jgi:mono/diheme cytochrome c family protein
MHERVRARAKRGPAARLLLLALGSALLLTGCGGGETGAGGGTTTVAGQSEQFGRPETGGDAAAGRRVFADAGCGGCHTLSAAGATGKVGPSLDESELEFGDVVERVREGGGGMPAFRDRLSEENIENVAQFVVRSAGEDGGA